MSSTAVAARPIFRSVEYIRELIRRNKSSSGGSAVPLEPMDPQPYMPASAFVFPDDEIEECETAE